MHDSSEGVAGGKAGHRGGGSMPGRGTTNSFIAAAGDRTSHTRLVDAAGEWALAGRQARPSVCLTKSSGLLQRKEGAGLRERSQSREEMVKGVRRT